ncbi:MAG: ParB/RepB/Spo0J family partition protein [Deltaproteobacteria bacterium]|nr:ParB/RepB/Spo0J family partition protein [Deltaproteobacteria bacterium]
MDLQELSLGVLDVPERPAPREDRIGALTRSVRVHGQREPIVVVTLTDGRFLVLDGARRVRALRQAGRKHAAAVVVAAPLTTLFEGITDTSRERWSRCDEIRIASRLSAAGLSPRHVSGALGKRGVEASRLHTTLSLRGSAAWHAFERGKLSGAHLRVLARVRNDDEREAVIARCLERALTVDELDLEVRLLGHQSNAALTGAVRALLGLFVEPGGLAHLETSVRDGGLCLWIGLGPLDGDEQEALRAWAVVAHDALLARLKQAGLVEGKDAGGADEKQKAR